nr:extensin family protein [Shimia biformata]
MAAITATALLATVAAANAPDRSLRPVAREDVFPVALPSLAPNVSLRPVLRPRGIADTKPWQGGTNTVAASVASASTAAVVTAPKPRNTAPPATPAALPVGRDAAESGAVGRTTSAPRKVARSGPGAVCKDRDLQGVVIGNVPGKMNGCGIKSGAVRLYSVSGVTLSTPAVMECQTAKALKSWVDNGARKSVGRFGGGIEELKVAAGYSCRTRNNKSGAKISEHGKGRAIDISAVKLVDGSHISVLDDWGKGKRGRILAKMHKSACGPFGTVLGPKADRYHKDHFHFDVARYRSGPYCR